MRTAYCPESHRKLASASVGEAYGHVPGHYYHDVDVVISNRGETYRCHVVEHWGSDQGYDEEHGRREVIGRGDTISDAARDAERRAEAAEIKCEYFAEAMSIAEDAASEALVEDA